jgi:hypothetical protein
MWNDFNTAFEQAEYESKLPEGEYQGVIIGCSFTEAKEGTMRWFNLEMLVQTADCLNHSEEIVKRELVGKIAKESLMVGKVVDGFMEPINMNLAVVKDVARATFGDITGMDMSTIVATLPQSVVDTKISFAIEQNFSKKYDKKFRNFVFDSAHRADALDESQLPF